MSRVVPRVVAVAMVTASVVSIAGVLSGPGAVAATDTPPATFSADPLPTWQTDGAVWALETIGDVVYVGGAFTRVRPPGVPAGGAGEVTRNNFAAFDAVTGALLPCDPSFTFPSGTPRVLALEASPGGDRLYVGGRFSRVGSTAVANLVAIDPAGCTLVPTSRFRRPNVGAAVRALSATGSALYVGGEFGAVDGQARTRFAALTSSGALQPATVTLDGFVRAVLAVPEVGRVLVGGDFATVDGAAGRGLVALDPVSLDVVQRFPGWIPANSVTKALARDADSFYVGAEGSGFGVFDGRIAGDLVTGAMRWKDYCLGATQALAVDGGVLYGGHHAHECSTTPGGWLEDGFRNHLTAQDVRTRELLPTFFPDTDDGIGTAPQGPRALVVAGDRLWVGGEFTTVNGGAQRGLTRFGRADTTAPGVPALSVWTRRAGANVLSWIAAFDRDDDALTYEVYRDDVLVHTVTAQSREWSRPQLSWVDTGVAGGQVAGYRLRVLEPDGGTASPKGPVTTVTTSSSGQGYPGAVLADGPALYWQLDETDEQDARTRTGDLYYRARMLDASGNARQGTADRGYTTRSPQGYALGAASALADGTGRAVRFNGTTGRIAEGFTNSFDPPRTAPGQYSLELWFRTSGSTGGRLAGFGDRRTELYERVAPGSEPPVYRNSLSTTTDRLLYLSDTGRVYFGALDGSTRATIVSPPGRAYNDGGWHHVVATSGPGGRRLYLDGVSVASGPAVAAAGYTGHWKLGYDSLTGWTGRPASSALSGDLDEFAVYHEPLGATAVARHYLAGRPDADLDLQPPTAPSGLRAVRSGQSVALTWTAATDDRGVAGYDVYRTAGQGDALGPAALVGSASGTSFIESGVAEGTWFYRVVARDAAGNVGPPSAAVSVTLPPAPVTLTVTPAADTYVNSALRTTNFGSSTSMIADSDPMQIGLLRFEVPAAPAGLALSGAVLRLRTTGVAAASSASPHAVRTADDGWVESAVTWNTRPSVGTATLGTVPAGAEVNRSYDVVLDPEGVTGLLGRRGTLALVPQGPDSVILVTREGGAGSRPQLVLSFSAVEGSGG